ncbi:vitamin K epoxide reductase family protein [Candidatus Microgenomates bacterium]|nr:vitamin K epoxide reductase family protein [Candidatus Microgenomates bacterium]
MTSAKVFFIVRVLAFFGTALAVYILWQQLFHPAFQPCRINSTINCDAIITGKVAKTAGIPTPLYGLAGYMVIFWAALRHKRNLLMTVSTAGLVFCLWIAYREIVELHVICPVCILCQAIMATIFVMSLIVSLNRGSTQ